LDPEAALVSAMATLLEGDFEECREFLENYRGWRAGFGFEPSEGDLRHDETLRLSYFLEGGRRRRPSLRIPRTAPFFLKWPTVRAKTRWIRVRFPRAKA